MNIRLMRTRQKLSQEGLSNVAGIDTTYVGEIERGERNISVRMLLKIASALECQPGELLKDVTLTDDDS